MQTIDMLMQKIHETRMNIQKQNRTDTKLALYVNSEFFFKLAKELHDDYAYKNDFNTAKIDARNKDHIMGFPIYEVHSDTHPKYLIVEILDEFN